MAERGVVGGVQRSLQSLMNMLTYAVGMVIVRPQASYPKVVESFMIKCRYA